MDETDDLPTMLVDPPGPFAAPDVIQGDMRSL